MTVAPRSDDPDADLPEASPVTPVDGKRSLASRRSDAKTHWGVRGAGEMNPWPFRFGWTAVLLAIVVGLVVLAVVFTPKREKAPTPEDVSAIVATPKSAVVSGPDATPNVVPTVDDGISLRPPAPGEHDLDPALGRAQEALDRLEETVEDYTATMVKRERVAGELSPTTQLAVKVRREQKDGDTITVPFSVYLRFEKPEAKKGQEAIWVRGQHKDQLVGHEGPNGSFITRQFRAWLKPEGERAMTGEKYPIHQIGLDRMLDKLIERGTTAKAFDDLEISQVDSEVDGRPTLLWKIEHTRPTVDQEFHTAEIWIDKQYKLPVKYQGYILPEAGAEPVLDEEYEYRDLKFNVGLTNEDFDPDNPAYNYPSFVAPPIVE